MTLLQAVLSYAFIFAVGYVAGRRVKPKLVEALIEEDPMNPDEAPKTRIPGSGIQWLVIGLLILALAVVGLVSQHRYNIQQECIRVYIGGTAQLAADRDKATQELWDDFKSFQTLDQTDPAAVKQARAEFFADLDKERAANKALQDYRDAHLPKEQCQ
jgi:hypothetical protein